MVVRERGTGTTRGRPANWPQPNRSPPGGVTRPPFARSLRATRNQYAPVVGMCQDPCDGCLKYLRATLSLIQMSPPELLLRQSQYGYRPRAPGTHRGETRRAANDPRTGETPAQAPVCAWSVANPPTDAETVTHLYQRYGGAVLRQAGAYTGTREDAEDLASSVWLDLTRAFPAGAPAEPWHWLSRVLRRRAIDASRRKRVPVAAAARTPSLPEAEVVAADGWERCLQSLPPRLAAVVRLVYGDGLTPAEAAAVLGISHQAAHARARRARAQLARCLQEDDS